MPKCMVKKDQIIQRIRSRDSNCPTHQTRYKVVWTWSLAIFYLWVYDVQHNCAYNFYNQEL